jgi:general secretion pathway protein G
MPTSAIYPNKYMPVAFSRGFTLVELLVVLVFMGLLSGIAFPNLLRMYERFSVRAQLDAVLENIESLGVKAHITGQMLVLSPATAAEILALPDGWGVAMSGAIVYRANGFCSGGELALTSADQTFTYTLMPPFCEPRAQ